MNNKTYSNLFLKRLVDIVGRNYHWQTEALDGGLLMAYANVPTVVGSREVGIFFNGERVWATMLLAEGFNLESLSHNDLLEMMYSINNITLLYGNLVAPVMVDNPNGGVNVFLRSVSYGTFQNDADFNNDEEFRDILIANVAGIVGDFITSINNNFGNTLLADFINMF